MFRPVVSVFFAVVLFVPRASVALDTRDIFKSAEPSVVVVLASDAKGEKNSLGSGVLIAPLDIVTSCKVVEGLDDIVVTQGSTLRKGVLRYKDSERDLCQLHFEDPLPSGKPAVVTAASTVEIGQEVFVISSPRGMDRTLNRAMVSGLQEMSGTNVRLMSMDKPFATDSVGGGVFDQEARLVGVITPQFKQAGSASHAIPATWIADLAQRSPDRLRDGDRAKTSDVPAATAQAALTADPHPAWMPKTGDFWKYRVTFGRREVGTVKVEIVEMRERSARERVTYDQSKGYLKERDVEVGFNPTRFQPIAALPGGYQLTDLSPYAEPDTPFKVGQKWSDVTGDFAPQGGSNTQSAKSEVWVAGLESVRVPAGQFKAWKIETTSERMYAVNFNAVVKCTYWYAPEVKRTVKMNLHMKASTDAYTNNETYELVSFEQGK
jgi:S1-C subfamily serine protease